jgi:hypothetical protein
MNNFKSKKLIILLLFIYSCQNNIVDKEKPNVVLIVADDLGWSGSVLHGFNLLRNPKY